MVLKQDGSGLPMLPTDFRVGLDVGILGRSIRIYDADQYTREFFEVGDKNGGRSLEMRSAYYKNHPFYFSDYITAISLFSQSANLKPKLNQPHKIALLKLRFLNPSSETLASRNIWRNLLVVEE